MDKNQIIKLPFTDKGREALASGGLAGTLVPLLYSVESSYKFYATLTAIVLLASFTILSRLYMKTLRLKYETVDDQDNTTTPAPAQPG